MLTSSIEKKTIKQTKNKPSIIHNEKKKNVHWREQWSAIHHANRWRMTGIYFKSNSVWSIVNTMSLNTFMANRSIEYISEHQ